MITIINGKAVMIVNGKASWAMNEDGWFQDIFEIVDGSKVKVNDKYTESQLRYRIKKERVVFE